MNKEHIIKFLYKIRVPGWDGSTKWKKFLELILKFTERTLFVPEETLQNNYINCNKVNCMGH